MSVVTPTVVFGPNVTFTKTFRQTVDSCFADVLSTVTLCLYASSPPSRLWVNCYIRPCLPSSRTFRSSRSARSTWVSVLLGRGLGLHRSATTVTGGRDVFLLRSARVRATTTKGYVEG